MTNQVSTLAIAAATFADDWKAFRSSSVTAENKGNHAAKSLLASLVSKAMTPALATAAIIAAMGNPKGKKGKPIETLSGLRVVNGGDGVRKMAETCLKLFENIDADSVIVTDKDNNSVGGVIRPLIVSFILGENDAPKSLRALNDAVASALRAYAKATVTDADAADDADEGATDATATPPQSLSDRILALMVAFEAASDDEKRAAFDAADALVTMLESDSVIIAHATATADEGEAIQQAA